MELLIKMLKPKENFADNHVHDILRLFEKQKQKLNFSHCALFHMKTRVSLKYFMNDCSFDFHCFTQSEKKERLIPDL